MKLILIIEISLFLAGPQILIFDCYLKSILNQNLKALPCTLYSPCLNGATCANDNTGGYACSCANGYSGTNCSIGKCFFLWQEMYSFFL